MTKCVRCGANGDVDGIVVRCPGNVEEPTCNLCRASYLAEVTTLTDREARVAALKQITGYTHQHVANTLGLEKSTVDEYDRRIQKKLNLADRTLTELEGLRTHTE